VFYQAFPVGKGKVLLRLENLHDIFDGPAQTKFVDIVKFSKGLWENSNPGKAAPTPKVEEMSLSGAIPLAQLKLQQEKAEHVIEEDQAKHPNATHPH